jgi:hypothetical protein
MNIPSHFLPSFQFSAPAGLASSGHQRLPPFVPLPRCFGLALRPGMFRRDEGVQGRLRTLAALPAGVEHATSQQFLGPPVHAGEAGREGGKEGGKTREQRHMASCSFLSFPILSTVCRSRCFHRMHQVSFSLPPTPPPSLPSSAPSHAPVDCPPNPLPFLLVPGN